MAFDAPSQAAWTGLGAEWLGGCCGTGPADIAALAGELAAGREQGPVRRS